MKLINFRCSNCNNEEEYFEDDTDEIGQGKFYYLYNNTWTPISCSKCQCTMNRFDFKNNSQRWKYCDAE